MSYKLIFFVSSWPDPLSVNGNVYNAGVGARVETSIADRAIADGKAVQYVNFDPLDSSSDLAVNDLQVTGVATFDDGTAALPSIHGADPDSGLYFGADTVGISTGGVQRAIFTSTGVGIGTTSPTEALEVVGDVRLDSTTNAYLYIDRSATNRRGEIRFQTAAADNWVIGATDSDDHDGCSGDEFYIGTASGSGAKLWIEAGGNVGIGTLAPSAVLEVAVSGSSDLLRLNRTDIANMIFSIDMAGTDVNFDTIGASRDFVWKQNGSEKMRIDTSGQLVIGTTNGYSLLTVSDNTVATATPKSGTLFHVVGTTGNARLGADAFAGSAQWWGRRANGTTTTPTALTSGDVITKFTAFGYGATGYVSTSQAQILMTATETWTDSVHGTKIEFQTTAAGSSSQLTRMTIDGDQVGIGTTNPGANLDVSASAVGSYLTNTVIGAQRNGQCWINILGGAASTVGLVFGDSAGSSRGQVRYENGADALDLYTSDAFALRIDSSGNVGIGTTSPDSLLDVEKSSASGSWNTFPTVNISNTNGTTHSFAGIRVKGNNGVVHGALIVDGLGTGSTLPSSTAGAYVGTTTNHIFGVATNDVIRMTFHTNGGVTVGNATGGSKGAGTLNAGAVYDDDTLLTDLVLDQYVMGSFDSVKYADHPIAGVMQDWWFDPDQYADFWKANRHLPSIPTFTNDNKPSTGQSVTQLTAAVETQAILIENLNQQIKELRAA